MVNACVIQLIGLQFLLKSPFKNEITIITANLLSISLIRVLNKDATYIGVLNKDGIMDIYNTETVLHR